MKTSVDCHSTSSVQGSVEAPLMALVGSPNCGKTAIFNALTGSRQKVGNYSGVTVERKEGLVRGSRGSDIRVLDLPGTYSLDARTLDEEVARDVVLGRVARELQPHLLVAVADATNLERGLALVLELKNLGIPMVLALNMMDLARARGQELDLSVLSQELGVPVVATVATARQGTRDLLAQLESALEGVDRAPPSRTPQSWEKSSAEQVRARFGEVDRILSKCVKRAIAPTPWTDWLDRLVLHPIWGSLIFLAVVSLMFQALFTWASVPADWIEARVGDVSAFVGSLMAEGPLKSLLIDGILAGVGGVLVFLPQILLLFAFILALEDSGYMARAAFLMDRLMGKVGLNGRSFIPLLSSYACAIPGIMATRTIENRRDRLVTILVAPLTTCSARLPVYTLLIAAFIPADRSVGPLSLQAAVMLGLYASGLVLALVLAAVFRRTVLQGPRPSLILELPTYKWPSLMNLGFGLLERAKVFIRRAGTVILALTVLVWFLSSYPRAPEGSVGAPIDHSYAGKIGHAIEPLIRPIGFDWRVGVALIPGFAAREVMVSALATVYSVEAREGADEDAVQAELGPVLRGQWSLATAASLLAWYVVALQCLSTLAVAKRETNSWRWPAFMLLYLTALAYAFAFLVYRGVLALGWN